MVTFVVADVVLEVVAIIWLLVTPGNGVTQRIGDLPVFYPFAATLDVAELELCLLIGAVVVGQVIGAIILLLAIGLLRSYRATGTPFAGVQQPRIAAMAWLALAMTVVPALVRWIGLMGASESARLAATTDWTGLILAVAFGCLAVVFEHGRILQVESDETL
jgi:hypothetical protein